MTICVATWNTQWATPHSDRGPRISAVIEAAEADVMVVTGECVDCFPPPGR